MHTLVIYLRNAPQVALTFKKRETAEGIQNELMTKRAVNAAYNVYDNYGQSISVIHTDVCAALVVDCEADMQKNAEMEIIRLKVIKKAEAELAKDPQFLRPSLFNGAPRANA